MVHFTSASSFVALAVLTLLGSSVTSVKARNVDKFYITEPACDSQGCTINVKPNSTLHINWLNPINGKIDITLVPEAKQRNARKTAKQLKSVKIAHAVAAHSHDNTCKKYDGAKSCGSFDWHVPADIKAGDYSIDIHSLHQTSVHGYSDIVVIESEKTAKSNGAPAAAAAKDTPTKRAADHEEESSAKIPKVVKKHKGNRKHKKGKHHGKEHKKVDDRAEEKGKKHEKAAKSTDKSKTDKKSSKNETDEKSNKKAKTPDDGKAKTDKKHKSKSSSKDDASHKKTKTDKSSKEHKAKGDEKKTSKSA